MNRMHKLKAESYLSKDHFNEFIDKTILEFQNNITCIDYI